MPYVLKGAVHHGGRAHGISHVVSDVLGAEMIDAGHGAQLTRVAYDPDLCANMLDVPKPDVAPAPIAKSKVEVSE